MLKDGNDGVGYSFWQEKYVLPTTALELIDEGFSVVWTNWEESPVIV